MVKSIGLGEWCVSSCEEDIIKTYALASCVGLVVYNPLKKKLGMAHIVLPQKKDPADVIQKPDCFFAELAVPYLFEKVFGGYPTKETPYRIALYGGASSLVKNDVFCVGQRNIAKIEEILIAHNVWYDKKNTGGHYSRTISANVKDGTVNIHAQKMCV